MYRFIRGERILPRQRIYLFYNTDEFVRRFHGVYSCAQIIEVLIRFTRNRARSQIILRYCIAAAALRRWNGTALSRLKRFRTQITRKRNVFVAYLHFVSCIALERKQNKTFQFSLGRFHLFIIIISFWSYSTFLVRIITIIYYYAKSLVAYFRNTNPHHNILVKFD